MYYTSIYYPRLADKETRRIDVIIVVAIANGLVVSRITVNVTRPKYHALNLVNALDAKTSMKIRLEGK